MNRKDVLVDVYLADRKLLRFIAARIAGARDAEDAIQEATLKVLKCGRDFPTRDDARRYLKRATVNAALDVCARRRRLVLTDDPEPLLGPASNADTPGEAFLVAERQLEVKRLARQALPALKRACRRHHVPLALFLGCQRGMLTKYSAQLSLPVSTLRSRYLSILRELRTFLTT